MLFRSVKFSISCSPEKDSPENTQFNYFVSRVRIRSEHCVGYLKGRFQSLRGLRLQINHSADVKYATHWIIAAIAVHNFAMEHENNADFELDEFFHTGREITEMERRESGRNERSVMQEVEEELGESDVMGNLEREEELLLGKIKRENSKNVLLGFIS